MNPCASPPPEPAPRPVRDYGDRALLLEFEDTATVLTCADAMRAVRLPGVVDVVPGARTVLVEFTAPGYLPDARRRLALLVAESRTAENASADATAELVIDVVYDGADLDDVARLTGLSPTEVVTAHTSGRQRVGFAGFAPGFAYLVGGDPRLRVPRRPRPRTRVPAGAVALAGEFSGIYPRESPGGWQLIGRTDAVAWDVDRDPPALLTPGTTVRFRSVGGRR